MKMGGGGSYYSGGGGGVGAGVAGETRDTQRLETMARQRLLEQPSPQRRRVFISYRFRDKDEVTLLRGQAKNENSELDFIDNGLRVPFNSENADYIKAGIRERIRQSSVTLVYVSDTTHESDWVNWEIEESIRQDKGIVVVRKDDSYRLPEALGKSKKVRVVEWNHKEIMNAINGIAS